MEQPTAAGGAGGYAEYPFTSEFYDHIPAYRDRADVELYVSLAHEAVGPILELGCGTGRILLPTARSGAEITGLDLSDGMLRICREKLSREAPEVQRRVRLIHGDMRRFDLGALFSLITIPFRAFQHLVPVEDQIDCLDCAYRHLTAGGRLVLDLFNPSMPGLVDDTRLQEWGDEPPFGLPDGRSVLRRFRIAARDWNRQVQDVEMIYCITHPDGREERAVHAFPMRYLFRFEAEHLLARCGFALEAVYGSPDGKPFGSEYPGEMICVAKKRGRR